MQWDTQYADVEKIASIEGIEYFVNNPFYESFYVFIDVQTSTEETKQFECHRLSPRQNVKGLVVEKTNFIGGLDLSDATALSSLGISNNPSVTSLDLTNTAFLNQDTKDFDVTMSNFLDCRDCENLEEIKIKADNKKVTDQVILANLPKLKSIDLQSIEAIGALVLCQLPNCDITYTYHKSSNNLKCHYCGYSMVLPNKCSICGSDNLKDYGLGTERLEEVLNSLYKARIVRMDVDTTSKRGQHQKIIDDFGEYKYDILIGTQMIAKGLDFPLVTLVGVVSIDSSLTSPDYRASENTFQLLSQVSGRAGRGDNKGEVIVQTFNPDHYAITLAKSHNYIEFYKEEMKIRKMLKYSPYYYMVLVAITSLDYELGFKEANRIGSYIRNNISKDSIVLGPTMANMFKVNNIYHYQIIIKYRKDDNLMMVLKFIMDTEKRNNKIDVSIDFDPSKI